MTVNSRYKWNPLDPERVRDPYPMYRYVQSEEPVHHSQTGEYILTRYEDVREVLRTKGFGVGNRLEWLKRASEVGTSRGENWADLPQHLGSFLLFLNPPHHTLVRNWLAGLWPDANRFRRVIHEEIDRLFEEIDLDDFDINKDLTRPLAGRVIARILGLSPSDEEELWNHGFEIVKTMDLYLKPADIRAIAGSLQYYDQFLREQVSSRALDPEGVLKTLLGSDRPISDDEFYSLSTFLFIAGLETTSSLMGSAVYHMKDRDFVTIQENVPRAVEEFARYDSPVQLLGRITNESVSIQGTEIPTGSTLTLVIGAANRDPAFFDRPDELDLTRERNPHLAFGAGAHYCLGDQLAKLETECLLEAVVNRFDEIEPLSEPEWEEHLSVRRMKNTRIRLTAT